MPAYSPRFNSIEYFFSGFKKRVKNGLNCLVDQVNNSHDLKEVVKQITSEYTLEDTQNVLRANVPYINEVLGQN